MIDTTQFEDRASRSQGTHEGESSQALCDRPSRTRDSSQRQLPTDHDHAVSTREYQTDQSSFKLPRLPLALSSINKHHPTATHRLTRALHIRTYAIATTSREIVDNERQQFLEKSLTLARSALALEPHSVEAREEVIAALHNLGRVGEEEKAIQELAGADHPPQVQIRAYLDLVTIYDEKDERSEALIAARKAEQISEVVDALTATTENDLIFSTTGMIGREELAAREEEAGEYVQAASDYEAARSFAKPGLYYDAVFFKTDMGLARSFKGSGQTRDADSLCDHWKRRATDKTHLLGSLDRGGGVFDSGGGDVASATWEFSCGNFDKGVQELIDIAQFRLRKPAEKWGDSSVGYYLRAPLDGLESAFLSHGSSELARQTRAILKLEEDPSISHLGEALKQVKELKESFITGSP